MRPICLADAVPATSRPARAKSAWRRPSLAGLGIILCALGSGCTSPSSVLDMDALGAARAGLFREPDFLAPEDDLPKEREPAKGSVWVGEMLAVFPGLLVHGLGHYYAGDHKTATRLRHIGEFGYVLTVVGGGLGVGGYYLGKEDLHGLEYSMYGTGGVLAVAGLTYIFTAWIYDMIDTPRAVRTGGEPPPRSEFIDSLDLFE